MSSRPNQWLRRNLHENGLPLPGCEGVYLRPGRLAVLSAGSARQRTDFLLDAAVSALVRSRAVLFLSRTPTDILRERLTDLRFEGFDEVSEKMQREFRRLRAEYFAVYNRSELNMDTLERELADFAAYERRSADLVLLDVGVLHPGERSVSELVRRAAGTRAGWIVFLNKKEVGENSSPVLKLDFTASNAEVPRPAIHIA